MIYRLLKHGEPVVAGALVEDLQFANLFHPVPQFAIEQGILGGQSRRKVIVPLKDGERADLNCCVRVSPGLSPVHPCKGDALALMVN